MRALPDSISRAAVAVLLLGLFAAPLAQASAELAASSHACCPEEAPQPEPAAPCQQAAQLTCCQDLGVPQGPAGVERPEGPALAPTATPLAEPPGPAPRLAAGTRAEPGAPLAPLAQTCALLL